MKYVGYAHESVQDIWQGHLHTRPGKPLQPKDHARDVGIVSVWILIFLNSIPECVWGAVDLSGFQNCIPR